MEHYNFLLYQVVLMYTKVMMHKYVYVEWLPVKMSFQVCGLSRTVFDFSQVGNFQMGVPYSLLYEFPVIQYIIGR